MGSFDILDLGLFGVRVDMYWNFNSCGDFCGGDSGGWVCIVGVAGSGLKVAQRVDFVGLVVVGRG